MKKVYLLLVAMLGLFVSTNVWADQFNLSVLSRDGYTADGERPLITDASQFSSPVSQNDLGNADGGNLSDGVLIDEDASTFWHSFWGGGSVTKGTHYFQVEMIEDYDPNEPLVFVFTRRNADNDQTTVWMVMGTDDPEATKAECEELAYIETPLGSNTETCMSSVFKAGEYQYLRFYSEEQTGSGNYGSRGYFHLSEFNIFPAKKMDDRTKAVAELQEIYEQYSAYEDQFYDRGGEEPGDYSQDAIDAFIAALGDYYDIDLEEGGATIEEIEACGKAIVDTYNAIEATKVPIVVESGYYRIHTAMAYNDGDMYMYGDRSDGKLWGKWGLIYPEDSEKENIQTLWKITAVTDTTYQIVNMFHDGGFLPVKQSTKIEMSKEAVDSLLFITAQARNHDEELTYVNIRLVGDKGNNYTFLHQNGHSNGAGTGDFLVGWCPSFNNATNTPGGSEWFLEEVPEDEALQIIKDYEPYKNTDIWLADFKMIMNEAPGKIEVAKDVQQIKIITDAAQMSSPYSHNDQPGNGSDGGNLRDGVLIDGKIDTYWHSAWQNIPEGKHYLQVELPDDFDEEQEIYMQFTRRNTNNNQIIDWSFKGTNDPEAIEDDCEELATFESPWNSGNQTESFKSDLFTVNGYKYIRFYNERNNAGSAFFHLSELQLCYDVPNPKSQYVAMGEIATNLEELVEKYAEYEEEDLEYEDYQALKAAYDAFVGAYVDPAVLRDSIVIAQAKADIVVAGNNPGFWPDNSLKTALEKTIADAKAYDEAGAYNPQQTRKFLDDIKNQMAAIDEAPLKIKEGKWYRFRFGTEEEFAKYGWGQVNAETGHISGTGNEANYYIVDGDTIDYYNQALFGKYITVAKREVEEIGINGEGAPVTAYRIYPIEKDEIALDNLVFCDELEDIQDPDMALFRFVNFGDTAYAIQNKATGLYFQRPSEGGDVRLGIHPALYTQKTFGWGQNSFFAKSLQGATLPPLHLAQSGNVLTQWGGNTSGWGTYDYHRGGFYVEEVADVAADYNPSKDIKIKAYPGSWLARTYPVTVTAKGGAEEGAMWTVNGIESTEGTEDDAAGKIVEAKITLSPITSNVAVAGRPFIYIVNGEYITSELRPDEYEPVVLNFSYDLDYVTKPQNNAALKGVLDGEKLPDGALVVSEVMGANDLMEMGFALAGRDASIGSNRAYISDTEGRQFYRKVVLEVVLDETKPDAINTAISNISRSGAIYTIDGRLVKAHGNANDLQNMPKGAYILNGTKVLVK